MPLKTYETIGILNRYITAQIDGRDVSIYFVNGTSTPRIIQGRFTTDNRKIQDYLENSGNFNKKYRLVSVVKTAEEKAAEQVEPVKPVKPLHIPPEVHDDLAVVPDLPASNNTAVEDDKASMSVPEETDEDIIPEPDITPDAKQPIIVGDEVVNGQQARNYLIQHCKDLTFRQVTNNAQIISEAKARGIQFTHWETFVTTK